MALYVDKAVSCVVMGGQYGKKHQLRNNMNIFAAIIHSSFATKRKKQTKNANCLNKICPVFKIILKKSENYEMGIILPASWHSCKD